MELSNASNRAVVNPASWVKLFGDYLFSYALFKVNNRETAEDLVQETFVSAIKAIDTFKGDSSEKTWLVTILNNKIIDYYRKKDVLKNTSEYLAGTDDDFSSLYFDQSTGHWLRSTAPQLWADSADREINEGEFEHVLQMCIDKMPPKLIPVFLAKFIDDKESLEICKVYNISSSNYWVMIHRAKVLIRRCLEQNWFLTKMPR